MKPTALVVEDDALQRDYIVTLLEESDMDVIGCKSAEAACACIDMCGNRLITDNRLAGRMTGCELAQRRSCRISKSWSSPAWMSTMCRRMQHSCTSR